MRQVEQFQNDSHHRFLITGRPLSLQGIEREISQRKNLERVELQPLSDELREQWYQQWAGRFGNAETDAFQHFLSVCPDYLLQFLEPRHISENVQRQGFAPIEGAEQ
ncbi:MAG: hypothetical protein ACKO7W_11335 [Elainella sp.]